MKRTVERRYYPTPALEKGLDILELFASTPSGLTVSEAARRLERTVSEIFRMVLCLEQRGYLAQSQDNERYHLTLRLFRLAQEHPPTKRLVMEALPTMHQLAHKLRQSCHLGVLDGGHVVILAQVDSPESTGFYVKVGSKVDLMHAATGHVILAHQSEEARGRAIDEWRAETKKRKPADLDEHLARILARGYERRASYEVLTGRDFSPAVVQERSWVVHERDCHYRCPGRRSALSHVARAHRLGCGEQGSGLFGCVLHP
jgi:DNA-binding IclR family transcriptional regulator